MLREVASRFVKPLMDPAAPLRSAQDDVYKDGLTLCPYLL